MTDNANYNEIEILKILSIINPKYSKDLDRLSNLERELSRAEKENASVEWINKLNLDISTLSEAIQSQRDAAEKFYGDMVEISNGITEFDEKTIKDILSPLVKYAEVINKRTELEKRKEQIEATRENGVLNSANQEELNKTEAQLRRINYQLAGFAQQLNSQRFSGYKRAMYEKIESSNDGIKSIEDAVSGRESSKESKIEATYRARLKAENEEELKRIRDMWNVLKSTWNRLSADAKKAGNMWLEFNAQAVSDAKRLGMTTKDEVMSYTESLIEKTQTLSRNFAMSRDEAMKMQDAYAKVTGRATLLTLEQMEDIAAASKLMGSETVQSAISMMDNMGTTSQTAMELLDSTYARARNAGVDIGKASETFVKNLALANKFNFKDGIDGISRMAVLSSKIRFDMQELSNISERVSSIEGAIETAAKLQVLGGAGAILGSNPMQLLYEEAADPEALYKRFADIFGSHGSFNRETGQAEITPFDREIIKEQAKAVGVSFDNAIQTAKQQSKIKEIESDLRRTSPLLFEKLTEEQRNTVYNKAEYDKEKQSFYINYQTEGGEEKKAYIEELANLSEADWKSISTQIEPVEDIRDNVRKIASELVGTKERYNSMKDQIWEGISKAIHPVMEIADGVLTWVNNSSIWRGLTTTFVGAVGIMAARSAWTAVSTAVGGLGNLVRGQLGNLNGKVEQTTPQREIAHQNGQTNTKGQASTTARPSRMARVGAIANTAFAVYEGYKKWDEINTRAEENLKSNEDFIKSIESSNYKIHSELNGTTRQYNSRQVEIMRLQAQNRAKEEKSGAVGGGVGAFGGTLAGGLAGAKIGAMIGTAILPSIGTGIGAFIGGGIGAVAGTYYGSKYGKEVGRDMASTSGNDAVNKELNEINKSDEEENFRKIVLPIESIDYNVSLIANRLGITSAMPAVGNVYLKAEAENVEVQPERVMQQTITHVNESSNSNLLNSYENQFLSNNSSVDLNVNGSINLKLDGVNISKISANDIKQAIDHSPEFSNYIARLIAVEFNKNIVGKVTKNPIYMGGYRQASGSNDRLV